MFRVESLVQSGKESETRPRPLFSLVVPTRNERDNIVPLFDKLKTSLPSSAEVIIVDDSDDETVKIVREQNTTFPVYIIERKGIERKGGLAAAVVGGIRIAAGSYIGIIDADLQHPPEMIPKMLERIRENDDDIVIASRYVEGGTSQGLKSPYRKLVSTSTVQISRTLFPKIRSVRDPNSGFFIFDRRILEGVELNPYGFRVLLELLVKTNWEKAEEIPFDFHEREQGESKATLAQGLAFYYHLYLLLRYKFKI